jgi:hypothetical protein
MAQVVSAEEMAGAIAQLHSQPTTMSGITLLDQHHGDLEGALEAGLFRSRQNDEQESRLVL